MYIRILAYVDVPMFVCVVCICILSCQRGFSCNVLL